MANRGYESLSRPEVIDALITARGPIARSGHRLWEYITWGSEYPPDNRLRDYSALCTTDGFLLYAGERTEVKGGSKVWAPAFGWRLIVEEARYRQFILDRGSRIGVRNPEKGRKPDTTFTDLIESHVNGTRTLLGVPTVVHGIEAGGCPFDAVIERILPPREGKGYFIHAIPI